MKNCRGFTLMEVTMALLLLAGALVVLLGLQSSTIQRAVRDRNQQQAMLIARSILAAVEVAATDLEPQDITEAPDRLIEKLVGAPPPERLEEGAGRSFEANLRIEEFELPVPNQDPKFGDNPIKLKQIVLTVFWGETSADQLQVVFLAADKEK